MHLPSLILPSLSSSSAAAAAARLHVPPPAPPFPSRAVRSPTTTQCTTPALTTTTTINRGNEGIWVIRPDATDLHELYRLRQTDWLSNDLPRVLDACGAACLAGNDTALPGAWLPTTAYFQGAFVNTPGGDPPNHILWQCACYDRAVTEDDLVPGAGVWNNANPGSGTIINRKC
ncbi:uncharacterized protein GGS25DRAFT_523248 [Hypoxylon fragiforme]|uniref:uncharacterized protein n=1 Tax=Hypoxylon fragiforme TaxID=63214 RepID=UPI0020C65B99|nr:uncharacterized protein GGS25DRAFT_523248 [Hypoxylon fragiforme]KAI2607723.1 hypothetical protein GGS25DRAFT_523248 [Hypoxylon fragiforme]